MRCVKAPEHPDRPLLRFLTKGHLIGIALAEECVFHAACTINKDDRHVISAGPRQVGWDIILLIILFERCIGRGAAEIVGVELRVTDDVIATLGLVIQQVLDTAATRPLGLVHVEEELHDLVAGYYVLLICTPISPGKFAAPLH